MKIFHTADWHLGKLVQGVYMTDDQRYVIDQFLEAIDEEQPDAIIIAGDLYDRPVPPAAAITLLDETLSKIVTERQIPLFAIAGNHDSPTRIHFGSSLMRNAGLHITGELQQTIEPIILEDEFGEVHFHLIPFAEPSIVKEVHQDETIKTYDEAMEKVTREIVKTLDPNARHIAVAHAFVTTHGQKEENTSDSERPLAIGGSECVHAQYFEPFHYTALGHLHRAHYVAQEKIRYSGSLLKYSSSEATQQKGYLIVNLNGDGAVEVEKRLFNPLRDLRIVEATLQELLKHETSEDYVFVRLTDNTPVVGAMEQIRTVYPNAMHVERKAIRTELEQQEHTVSREKLDDRTLFKSFYEQMAGKEMTSSVEKLFNDVLQQMLEEEREKQEVRG